jgi:dolichyl-phosphate-mannose-protein mannosyltransferase
MNPGGPGSAERWTAGALLLAVALPLLHLPMLGLLPVSGDEAYYWQCSRHPDWSYFDQPPLMIALMGISTRLLGINETATRLPAVLIGLAIALCVLGIGRRLFRDGPGAFWALAGLAATPLFALGTLYSSTDILLCLFALGVPALAAMAILEDRPRLWLLVGFLGGLGGLAKLSAVLYVPAVVLLPLLHPAGRRHLRRKEPYLGALLGLAAVSPNLIWAALHGMDNITFQLMDRHIVTPFTLRWLGEYLVPQFLLLSPLLFPLLLVGLGAETWRALRERDVATLSLALPAGTFFLFFALVALKTDSAPHWAAPAATGGALVTARWVLRRWKAWRPVGRAFVAAGLAFGLLLSAAGHSLLLHYDRIPPGWSYNRRISSDTVRNLWGWKELTAHLRTLEGKEFEPARDPLICDSYTTASLIAFYSGGRYDPMLLASAGGRHGLAYLYWQEPSRWIGRPGLYVGDWRKAQTREDFEKAFGEVRMLESFSTGRITPGGPPGGTGSSQTWQLVRGEHLSSTAATLEPFRPEGRRLSRLPRERSSTASSSRPPSLSP